jgi:hypothetical protein
VPPAPLRREEALTVELTFGLPEAHAFRSDHAEDLAHDPHLRLADHQGVPILGVGEAVGCLVSPDNLALAHLPVQSPPGPLGGLRTLELGELIQDAVRELTLRRIVSSVVESTDLGAVLLALSSK